MQKRNQIANSDFFFVDDVDARRLELDRPASSEHRHFFELSKSPRRTCQTLSANFDEFHEISKADENIWQKFFDPRGQYNARLELKIEERAQNDERSRFAAGRPYLGGRLRRVT